MDLLILDISCKWNHKICGFYVWLLSFSMFSRFIHVVQVPVLHSFLWLIFRYIDTPHFVYPLIILINLLLILFIYFWLHWVFVAACRLSLVAVSGAYSSLRCAGFTLQWLVLWSTGSRRAGWARAQLLHGLWDLPGPGIKPVSPALAGDRKSVV